MKRILFLLLILTLGFAETILIPEDYATIQEGIDASVDGDTVLVADGDYVENLVLDKSIVLTSYAIYDNLDEWIIFDDYFFNQWVINNSHIENTRLIGSSPDDPDYGSVILITPDAEECISPEIVGFTIQGGSGTKVVRVNDEGQEYDVILGGGILADVSDPHIHHNAFENNGSEEVYSGGAAQLTSSAEDWSFDNRFEDYNPRCDVEEFRLSDNLYNGNDAQYGNSMANRFHEDEFDMSGSIFDVFDCGNEESAVSTIWVKVEPTASVDYDDGAGQLCAFTAPDVYVDSSIEQECLDEGCGFSNNPFKTISRTFEMINATESNPITIHLAAGTYSPESGENFPINMMSNVNLVGEDEETSILDAQGTARVIRMENCKNNTISGITITGGLVAGGEYPDYYGGGMSIYYSNPTLTHVTIAGNTSYYSGGMSIYYSNPMLTHVTISNNTSEGYGGGMRLGSSNPILTNVTITGNTAGYGGGMSIFYSSSSPTLTNSIIWDNNPESILSYGIPPLITFSDIEGGWEGAGNIDADPLFTDPDNGDYTLQEGSACIDAGNPNLWYQDVDGTVSDMGATGGSSILPNFIDYDFGEVGDIGSSAQFVLHNFRETPITISSVNFGTASFTTDASFPMTIAPLETGIINIEANNASFGYVEDIMEIISDDLPEGLLVSLSITGTQGNVLTGNLSGTYPAATYRISGDLTITDGDTAYLDAGTQFLFEGGVNFNIYGTLKAIGTESDSIIFDNYDDDRWSGFTLDNASDETEFQYVRISGGEQISGGGMFLSSSNPTLTHVTISNNTAFTQGGGMYVNGSNPILTNVTIAGNTSYYSGGMSIYYSNPTLTHVTITGNTASSYGGGMRLTSSNPILTHVTITGNTAESGGGMYMRFDSNPTLSHVTITGNTAGDGGGMSLNSSNPTLTNSIVWNNSPESVYGTGTPIITYSDIEGGWEGEGNIDIDPLFTDPENGDYTLQENSPCIDAGIEIEDMEYFGSAPDMGAFEFCAYFDECGICGGDNSSCSDCAGTPNGDAVEDNCGICDNDSSNDCVQDCAGEWGGLAVLDECGVCGGSGIAEGTCDCDGNVLDECDICGGDGTSCIMAGDTNFDGIVDILDIVRIINQIMGNSEFNDDEFTAADFNADGIVDVLDIVQIVNYILP